MKNKIVLSILFLTSFILVGCGDSTSKAFGGNCDLIKSRLDAATIEVKDATGLRDNLNQLVKDFESITPQITDQGELDLINSIVIDAAWIADYYNFPEKDRIFTIEKVSNDYLSSLSDPLLNRCWLITEHD